MFRRPDTARTAPLPPTEERKASEGNPPHFAFHIHLELMAQMLRETSLGEVTPHRLATIMSQFSSAVTKEARFSGLCRSQCRSFEKPHSEE
jgi:hypothetical protein